MKKHISAVCATLAGLALAARVVELPQLPEGELPNSEVVTNIALGVNLGRLDWLAFSLTIHHRDINPRWNRLRIVKRGLGDIQMEAVQSSAMKKFILKLR